MVFGGHRGLEAVDVHVGYVAGRYRDGVWSDDWTDVRRCAEATFTAYAPVCGCGWRGRAEPATAEGYRSCQREWAGEHVDPAGPGRTEAPDRVLADALIDALRR